MMHASTRRIVVLVCLICLCGVVGPVVGASTGASNPLSAGTQHQANQQAHAVWTEGNAYPYSSDLGMDAWSNEEQAVSGSVAETRANSLDGPGGDTQSQQDNASDDESTGDYTIRIGMVEVPIGEAITKTIEFVVDKTVDGIASLVDTFNEYILGLPAPGEPTDVSTWMTADGWWSAVYGVYGIMSALAIALLTPSFMVATDTTDPRKQHERLVELGKAAFFILLGIPVTAFCLHLGNELTMAVAPSGLDFITSFESLSKLSLGIIFGFILIMFKAIFVGIGVLIVMLIHLVIYLTVAFWPLFWAFRVQPQGTLKGFGHMGIAIFPLVILLKFVQAGILRFLFLLPYDQSIGDIFNLVATGVGATFALIVVPYVFFSNLLPKSVMLLKHGESMSTSNQKRGQTTAGETPGGQYTSRSGSQPAGAQGGYYAGPRSQGPATTRQPVEDGARRSNVGPNAKSPGSSQRSGARTHSGHDANGRNDARDSSGDDDSQRSRSTVGPQSRGPND